MLLDFPHGDSPVEGKAAPAGLYAAKGVAEIDVDKEAVVITIIDG